MIVHDVARVPLRRAGAPPPSAGGGSELARRANAGPHATSLAALGSVVAQRMRTGAVVQRVEVKYAGSKAALYEQVVGELRSDPTTAGLIERVLAGGDVTIQTDPGDDTRYERATRTIHVARGKKLAEVRAAILFELNNAANPHTYTDAAEQGLSAIAEADGQPSTSDYLHVAKEMEKDEFVSLVNYAHQGEALALPEAQSRVVREKYEDLEEASGLSYARYDDQNRRSGHTVELAEAQYDAFTGSSGLPGLPYAYRQPGTYDAYQAGTLRPRARSQVESALEEEQRRATAVDPRLTSRQPPWDPSAIVPTYHLAPSAPSSSSPTLPAPPAPSQGAPSASVASAPPTVRRGGRDDTFRGLEQRLGISISLTDEEIAADLEAIRKGST